MLRSSQAQRQARASGGASLSPAVCTQKWARARPAACAPLEPRIYPTHRRAGKRAARAEGSSAAVPGAASRGRSDVAPGSSRRRAARPPTNTRIHTRHTRVHTHTYTHTSTASQPSVQLCVFPGAGRPVHALRRTGVPVPLPLRVRACACVYYTLCNLLNTTMNCQHFFRLLVPLIRAGFIFRSRVPEL